MSELEILRQRLWAKLEAARELLEKGSISRAEAFRCEMDLSFLIDTGPIRFLVETERLGDDS